jgi:hypothetical protein
MAAERDATVATCRRHHGKIRRLLDEVCLTEPLAEASIVRVLERLKPLVAHHLELEERALYPALERSTSAILQRKATRYRTHMLPIGETFIKVCQTWCKPGAISAAPSRFTDEWLEASGALRMRMESEDEDLYALAEILIKSGKIG